MYAKNYICIDEFGDMVDLSILVNEYIRLMYTDYIEWLEGEEDSFYYRLDFIGSDSGYDFEQWLKKEYPYISLLNKKECI